MNRYLIGTLLAGAMIAATTPTLADVIARDSYDGYAAGNLTGQTSTTAVGFTGAWSAGSANVQVESGGILDGDATSGQGRFIPVGQAFGAYRGKSYSLAPIASDPPNNTFYTSQLLFTGGTGGTAGEYAMVGFGSFVDGARFEDSTNFLLGAFTGFVNTDGEQADLVIRSRTGAVVPGAVTDTLLVENAENTTYRVVMALEYNNPGDEIRYWVNPTDFNNGEAGLTASALTSGSIGGFQLGALSDMDRFSVGTTYTNRSFFWDEVVLASSVAALPEPTSLLLAALAAVGVATRRR